MTGDNIATPAGPENCRIIPELQKLGVAPGQSILLRKAPKAFLDEFGSRLPSGVQLWTRTTHGKKYDLILEWLASDEKLDPYFERMQQCLKPEGALWVVIPNQRAARARGERYDWSALIAAALKTTLVDNKTLSFSPEEYGTRFVVRKVWREKRGK